MTSLDDPEIRRAAVVSRRGLEMPASPIRKLAPLADAAKARGTRVLHLNIGQPDIETPACIRDRLKQLDARVLEYSPSAGTPEFLGSLKRYYERRVGVQLHDNQVLATTGGSEAVLFAFLACANEGDDVLVVEPFYANYKAFAVMAGVRLVPVMSHGRDGFHLPPRDVFERALTPRSRIVLLCNPNNPTGTVYGREELEMLADFCRRHGLFLVSDEVYREFVYDRGVRAISALELGGMDDLVVVSTASRSATARAASASARWSRAIPRFTTPRCAWPRDVYRLRASRSSSPSAPTTSARSTRARSSTSTAAAATCCMRDCARSPA